MGHDSLADNTHGVDVDWPGTQFLVDARLDFEAVQRLHLSLANLEDDVRRDGGIEIERCARRRDGYGRAVPRQAPEFVVAGMAAGREAGRGAGRGALWGFRSDSHFVQSVYLPIRLALRAVMVLSGVCYEADCIVRGRGCIRGSMK